MREMTRIVAVALLLLVACPLAAQVQIEKRRPTPAKGMVSIDNSFGSVTVRGWEKNEVLVKGELAPGARGLELDGDKEGLYIGIDEPDHWFYAPSDDGDFRTRLEVMVPAGSNLGVETVNASVDVAGVHGELELHTVNGNVTVAASTSWVEVQTMTGVVDVTAEGAPMMIESITGGVTLRGAAGEVDVESIEGSVSILGRDLAAVSLETVTGAVSVSGTLAKRGQLEVDTFSGAVTLVLPPDIRAEFQIETFSGQISSDLGPKTPVSQRFEPYRILEFSTGFDEYEIEVTTHEGDVNIRAAGDPGAG